MSAALLWLAAATVAESVPEGAVGIELIAWPALAPDGERVVFEWLDDLWTASTDGGEAIRLTDHPARDAYPKFTPDGLRVVFTSDRDGAAHVYSVPVAGGEIVRHTHHTGGNVLEAVSADGTRAIVRGLRERSGYRATRLMEIDLTAERRERRLFDATAHSANWSPDGSRVLFCRGGEQLYRKGYQGSRASQIWQFDARAGSLTRRDDGVGEARSPLWHADGAGFYYVSSKSGAFNLWSKREAESAAEQITFFKDDGVILPDLSRDGSTLVFRVGAVPHRFRPGKDEAPVPLEFWTRERLRDAGMRAERATGTNHADFTPKLDRVVFSALGDLWLAGDPKSKPRQLTQSPGLDGEVRFSGDGGRLFFLRDDGLVTKVMGARLVEGALFDEQVIRETPSSKSRLLPAPDGSRIAWVEGTGDVFTALEDGSGVTRVFECWDKPTMDWSPDGRWLVLAARDAQANRDLWLVPADGSAAAVNLTSHPAFDGSPRWSPDGRWIAFISLRGESGEATLWRIDLGVGGLKSLPDAVAARRLGDRARELPTRGVEPERVVWTADSKALWFQSTNEANPRLYSVPVEDGSLQTVAEYRGVPIRMTAGGELLWRVDRVPAVFKDGELRRFPISLRAEQPRGEFLRVGFRRIWRTLGERFYDPAMNGLDWPAMLAKYEDLAAGARDSRQFDRVVGHLLGELNASHLTFLTDPWPSTGRPPDPEPETAHSGLVFDDSARDGPLRIRRVIAGSPVALLADPPVAGEVVVRLAGEVVDAGTPLHRFLAGAEGRSLPLVLRDAAGRERTLELRCISYSRARLLDQREREEQHRAAAAGAAVGRIAYLPFREMKWESFLELEREIFRASADHDGLILDLRDNGGGRVADQLLAVFCQPVHARTVPRNGPEGYPHDRRVRVAWDKPLVVLCNENTYSNAEIFCHAIQQAKRAPLVGNETAGGVISAVSTRISGIGKLQVPFRGWYHAETGANLDHRGAVPEHLVPMTPADEAGGADPQLAKALEVMEGLLKPR